MSKYECKKSHKMKLELSETIARNKINLVDCIRAEKITSYLK